MQVKTILSCALLLGAIPSHATTISDTFIALNNTFEGIDVYTSDDETTHGFLYKKGAKTGSFFELNHSNSELVVGTEQYRIDGDTFTPLNDQLIKRFKEKTIPHFAKKYGIPFSKTNGDNVYVFLDYSCSYSRSFVASGGLESLKNNGDNVVVLPISRSGRREDILSYGKLHCFVKDDSDKLNMFMSWLNTGNASNMTEYTLTKDCDYWGILKPYYSIVEHLGVTGVPAVIRAK